MSFDLPVTVYYEDTDLAGIVYYANYLKFIERGRSTLVRRAGIDQVAMKEAGMVFCGAQGHGRIPRPCKA